VHRSDHGQPEGHADPYVQCPKATLDVHYLAGGRTFSERFTLVLLAGAWRIDDSGPL
jgi:hypothetical protein